MRKLVSLFIAVIFVMTLITGCGSSSKDNGSGGNNNVDKSQGQGQQTTETAVEEKKPQKVAIIAVGETIEDTVDATTGMKIIGLNEKFKDFYAKPENQHITVEFIETPWAEMSNKINAMNADGSLDIMCGMGPYMPAAKSTMHITELYDRDFEEIMSYYPESVRPYVKQWTKPDDVAVGLVQRIWPYVIAYDKKIFDDFGVPYLKDGYTAEEFVETVKKLTGINPRTGKKTYGLGVAANDGWKLNEIVQDMMDYYNPDPEKPYSGNWGGTYFDATLNPHKYFNNGNFTVDITSGSKIKAFEAAFDLIGCMPPGALNGEGLENWFTEDNNVAIWFYPEYGPYGPYVEQIINGDDSFFDRYGVVGTYKRPDNGRGGFCNLTYVYMASNAKVEDPERKEAVWSVMKYLASFDYNKYYYLSNLEPSIQIGYEEIRYPADKGFDSIMKHILTLNKLDPSWTAPHDWQMCIDVATKAAEQSTKGLFTKEEIHKFAKEMEATYQEKSDEFWKKNYAEN